jgi:D-glutamate cyclase
MTTDEKLAAILAAVQTDPGNRGLARDPHDNLFTATKGDFEAACRSIAGHPDPSLAIVTGFFIPTAMPPAMETDGPLGTLFLYRAFKPLGIFTAFQSEPDCFPAFNAALELFDDRDQRLSSPGFAAKRSRLSSTYNNRVVTFTHLVALERVGPGANGRCHTMRGIDITDRIEPAHELFADDFEPEVVWETIGIGDGGNEIGMGKIPHETIVKNIPNGDLIHCRVPTDHLIVAGVSNWGAYALAAGVYVLRGAKPPVDLFNPSREQQILEVMVREGPLVDGVTGKQTATVDGLTWEEYTKPLVRIREILES